MTLSILLFEKPCAKCFPPQRPSYIRAAARCYSGRHVWPYWLKRVSHLNQTRLFPA